MGGEHNRKKEIVSIHALLAECDSTRERMPEPFSCFNPRTPCGVRPSTGVAPPDNKRFQSTHSLRSATKREAEEAVKVTVSIHALLAECDQGQEEFFSSMLVSIHALLAECDLLCPPLLFNPRSFNPRTPCGVRLFLVFVRSGRGISFNPRTPCGVRRKFLQELV